MLDHKAMDSQDEFDVVELCSPDGTNKRKVGLVAVLSNDPKLYAHFKGGAFGGATIDDPWETLERMKIKLTSDDADPAIKCDTILPLQHLYVPDDHITCRDFDFPVILSGHDHHRVDEVVEGTRLLKPGMDAVYATVMDMSWPDATVEGNKPTISARFVKTSDWEPDEDLQDENERAYDVLAPLRNTELAKVPPVFEPLSSSRSRGEVCTMGLYICALLRSSLNLSRNLDQKIDAVLLMGGNIRGGREYEAGSYFSLEALEEEIKNDEVLGVVPMPGWLLSEGVTATHAGGPIPGWMQYDNGILEDYEEGKILQVGGRLLDPDRIYRVATKISDLTNGQSPPWTKYYKEHPELLPPKGAYINIQAELMSYFAQNLWRRIWESLSEELDEDCEAVYSDEDETVVERNCNAELRLEALDKDDDGIISVEEIQDALQDIAGLNVDPREMSLAEFVHDVADATNSGEVTIEDLEMFCEEMADITEREKLGKLMTTTETSIEQKP
jgi:Ca2+-binding EF-hand superfamily protein